MVNEIINSVDFIIKLTINEKSLVAYCTGNKIRIKIIDNIAGEQSCFNRYFILRFNVDVYIKI